MRLPSRDRRLEMSAVFCFRTDLDCIFGKACGECDIIVVSSDVFFFLYLWTCIRLTFFSSCSWTPLSILLSIVPPHPNTPVLPCHN